MDRQNKTIEATETSFKIINQIKHRQSATLTTIAENLDLPKSTVYYHLNTLEQMGYLEKAGEGYTLSLRFLTLGESARNDLPIYSAGKKEVEKLAEQTETNGYLMVEQNGVGVIVYLRKENDIHLGDAVGQVVHLTSTAMGKVFLAHRPKSRIEEVINQHGLPQVTKNTITNKDKLMKELNKIESQGYAINKEEQVEGLHAVGAPILGQDGEPRGAISISAPKQQMSEEVIEDVYLEKVLNSANIIELKLVR
jgi:DNA-binding IclR family transcriptional regulator